MTKLSFHFHIKTHCSTPDVQSWAGSKGFLTYREAWDALQKQNYNPVNKMRSIILCFGCEGWQK